MSGDIRQSRDSVDEIRSMEGLLDQSKFEALREAWAQLPVYFVQGPPGVGKTRLVDAIVSARLGHTPTDRLVLSAQSHSAIDHLLDEIQKSVSKLSAEQRAHILPLRCRPADHPVNGDWDRRNQARVIAGEFANSPLVANAPRTLRARAKQLSDSYNRVAIANDDDDVSNSRGGTDRSFEALLLRAANLVFASTNSRELAQLVEERGQFDWSIVEEAGKATGIDLLPPMLLSHRRLLIGDHQQLPAFDAERLKQFLEVPSRISAAISAGRDLISPIFRKLNFEDALDALGEANLEAVASAAVGLLLFFERSVVDFVLERSPTSKEPRVGRQLLHQHRMHPTIAKVVSDVFYKGAVETAPMARARFEKASPVVSADPSRLPDAPITFIDMPYVQEVVGMKPQEAKPRWTNEAEAEACLTVLSLLRAREGEVPSLAVLSPYNRQRLLIESRIRSAGKKLDNLGKFTKPDDDWCGTVDSFQGNEADAVIVSLVRNNDRTGIAGLGFLADKRRMNVLLSRAKWRMIVIGSLDFLDDRFLPDEKIDEGHKLAFLHRMLNSLRPKAGKAVPGIEIVSLQKLMGSVR